MAGGGHSVYLDGVANETMVKVLALAMGRVLACQTGNGQAQQIGHAMREHLD